MTSPVITMTNVSKSFAENRVIDDMSLSLGSSGVLGITGHSGSGKTTLTRLLMRLETPDSGTVEWSGDLTFAPLFAEDRLLPHLTVAENFDYVSIDSGLAQPVLEKVGVGQVWNMLPKELSTGMSRRVAFARAFTHPADVLILDEPFRGVDVATRTKIADAITARAEKMPVVLVDHDTALVKDLATSMIDMEKR